MSISDVSIVFFLLYFSCCVGCSSFIDIFLVFFSFYYMTVSICDGICVSLAASFCSATTATDAGIGVTESAATILDEAGNDCAFNCHLSESSVW